MFGFFKKADRYNELYDHLVNKWGMKSGFAAAFLNEYRHALAAQYEKGLSFHRQQILTQSEGALEEIFISLRDTTLVSQAYLAYMNDLRSGKYVGTNIEKAIWAILVTNRRFVALHNLAFAQYLGDRVETMFPSLINSAFNDAEYLLSADIRFMEGNESSRYRAAEISRHSRPKTSEASSQPPKVVEISPSPSNRQPPKQDSNKTPTHSAPPDIADRLDKDDIYKLAISHVAYQLRLKGFEIIYCGGSRGDEVSIKAHHEGQNIYILVAAALHPQKPSSPRFMVDRLVSTATTDGAEYYICQVAIKVSEGTDLNKVKNGAKDGVNYEFSGLLKQI